MISRLNEKEINDLRVQAVVKRSRHSIFPVFIIIPGCYELPKRTIIADGNVYHIFKPNIFRDVPDLYQDKAGMDMTLEEFKF